VRGCNGNRSTAGKPRHDELCPHEDAELDLDGSWEYIAADSIDAADRWIDRLFEAFEAIGKNPGIGHRRDDLTAYPVLFWPVGAYLIVYRANARPAEIVAVTRGGRDIPSFLSRRFAQ
jgi:plasmid stabilization system protein ParE